MRYLLIFLLIFGCAATGGQVTQAPSPQLHEIKITAAEPVTVAGESPCFDSVCTEKLYLSDRTRIGADNKAYMTLWSGIGVSDWKFLLLDFLYLRDFTNIRDIVLFLNSPGGDAFQGLNIAETLYTWQKKEGFSVEAHGSGIIASAAVPIFAACEKRTCNRSTIFMVHEAALFKWGGYERASDIKSQNELMELLSEIYMRILGDGSTLSIKRWQELEKCTTWFSAEQAKEWGLVQEIR